jgi:crotonobetainyl-CoA:carnitine CoA-transferase CaiB-like acyl-CoA transferase
MGSSSRRLSAGELAPLTGLLEMVGLTGHFSGDAVMRGDDPVIRSPHRLGEASAIAHLLIGVAGAAIWEARTLAEYGAAVLHISSPWFADARAQHLGVDVGKYDAYLDLRGDEDMARMRQLAATADVFASTYRPAVNQRFGLLPERLAAGSERGIVYMSGNAYGHSGPWKDRPGFDQNGQVASGFAMTEGQGGPPGFSPVFYLGDLIMGYFAAAGMMAALHRRAIEGGSYQVKLSLTRSAMWVEELGLLDVAAQGDVPETDSYPAQTVSIDTAYGAVTSLAPPLTFSNLTLPSTDRLVPYGADPPAWPSASS